MEKYIEIFKHSPGPAILIDGRNEIENINEAAAEIFFDIDDRHTIVNWLYEDITSFRKSNEHLLVFEKVFEYKPVLNKTFRIRMFKIGEPGVEEFIVIILTDITERRRHIEEIGRLASIVDSSDDAIISISLENRILSWNHGAEKIYGYSHFDIIGKSYMLLIPKVVQDETRKILSEAARGKPSIRYETVHCSSNGNIFPVSATFSPFVYYDDIIGVSIISRDISKRRQAEEELKDSHERLKALLNETVASLSTAHEKRDLYTAGHQKRVSKIACCIADEMFLSFDDIEALRIGGLLHDIGKVCIPMAILAKPSILSPEEMALMKKHPEAGYEILRNIPFPWPVGEIILQHHERINGSGYPKGLKGDAVSIGARVLAVADTLEAMSSHRPYRPALGLDVAMAHFSKFKGVLYDSDVLEVLEKLVHNRSIRMEKGEVICE